MITQPSTQPALQRWNTQCDTQTQCQVCGARGPTELLYASPQCVEPRCHGTKQRRCHCGGTDRCLCHHHGSVYCNGCPDCSPAPLEGDGIKPN